MLAESKMKARVLKLSDRSTVLEAARTIADSGVVVAPTETRYGILVRADNDHAVQSLFEIKGRSQSNPTALFVGRVSDIARLGVVTPTAQELADTLLPGPLTLVLMARTNWGAPRVVNGKIGFRVSSSEFVSELIDAIESPITATSANLSGQPEREAISEIMADFGDRIDLYVDGGRLTGPVSTVVECIEEKWKILREGAIPADRIAEIASRV